MAVGHVMIAEATMSPAVGALIFFGLAFIFGLIGLKIWFELTNGVFRRIAEFTSGDRGRLTQRKADYLNEKEARSIYGDAEVDRFLQYGDYDPHTNQPT
jgi:hypothetical protein